MCVRPQDLGYFCWCDQGKLRKPQQSFLESSIFPETIHLNGWERSTRG